MKDHYISPNILTQSGNLFNFEYPYNNKICIEDIAHALSHICRFTGHTSQFYSVAQHSVIVSRTTGLLTPSEQMAGLLHDAAEAFIGDVSLPLKQLLPDYKVIEGRVERAIFTFFGIRYPLSEAVKFADLILLATERRDLMPERNGEWALLGGVTPLRTRIVPWSPERAESEFMARYEELTKLQDFGLVAKHHEEETHL